MIDRMPGTNQLSTNQLSSFWLSLLFLPVVHCIFVGQSAILLGLLPLSSGLFLLRRHRPASSGLLLSLTFLKPQFLIAAAFVAACQLKQKNFKTLLALLGGVAAQLLLAFCLFGAAGLEHWLQALPVVDSVYSSGKNGVVQTIVASFPRMAILSAQPESIALVKLCTLALAAIATIFAAITVFKAPIRDERLRQNGVLLLALNLVPLLAPYLFYYDLSSFLLGWAAIQTGSSVFAALLFGLSVNAYGILVVVPALAKLATPWLLLLIYLEMYRRLVSSLWAYNSLANKDALTEPE